MIKQFLLLSLSVAIVFAAIGYDTRCNSNTDSKSCGPSGGSTWVEASVPDKFRIKECAVEGQTLTGIFDTYCGSCYVESPRGRLLTVNGVYANETQDGCTSTPVKGDNVECQKDESCNSCGKGPSELFLWQASPKSSTNCYIVSCLATPIPSSGLTDYFCRSCGKTNKFANSYGSACVNPTGGNCIRQSDWTDADCKICNANGANSANFIASSDKTKCVSSTSTTLTISFISLIFLISSCLLF